jgi:MFS family permease
VAAGISYPAGSWSDRFGRRNVLGLSFIIFALTYLGFGVTRNVMAVAACFVLYGLYQGTAHSVGKALATDLVPSTLRASGLGWYSATTGLLGLVASIVAGNCGITSAMRQCASRDIEAPTLDRVMNAF